MIVNFIKLFICYRPHFCIIAVVIGPADDEQQDPRHRVFPLEIAFIIYLRVEEIYGAIDDGMRIKLADFISDGFESIKKRIARGIDIFRHLSPLFPATMYGVYGERASKCKRQA
ncbi:MAG: hypothetical protein ABW189_01520 [Rickettsiales bacterium]